MMRSLSFAGPQFSGYVDIDARGITLCAAPSDPDAAPYLAAVTIDPSPEQAKAIAEAIEAWAWRHVSGNTRWRRWYWRGC